MRDTCRWRYNVKANIREEDSKNVDWIQMVSDSDKWWTLVDTIVKSGVTKICGIRLNN